LRLGHRKADLCEQPEIIIKLIIKLRILADCWNKHRVLGAIPVEIHVLDHLRRTPYVELLPPLPIDRPAPSTGHPNICIILDFFEDPEHWYLCMAEFGQGLDLFDYVDKAPDGLALAESQSFLTQIARAIAFLHMHGIVHRDIKDENIILDGEGRVQLVDFGSAAYIKEGRKFDTFSGTLECVRSWLSGRGLCAV
jgi:serine/threonine protein kinase